MSRSGSLLLVAVALFAPTPALADEVAGLRPHVVVQAQPLEKWFNDARVASKAMAPVLAAFGQNDARPEDLLTAVLGQVVGNNFRAAVDETRPWGLYATLKNEIPDSDIGLLLPVKEPRAILMLLEALDIPAKEEKGLYKLAGPTGQQMYMRFAEGYAYFGTNEGMLRLDRIVKPSQIFVPGQKALISARARFDLPPTEWKSSARAFLDDALKNGLPEQKKAFEFFVGLAGEALDGSKDLTIELSLDAKTGDATIDAELTPVPNSKWAGRLGRVQLVRSRFGKSFDKDAAVSFRQTYEFPNALYYSPELIRRPVAELKPELEELKIDPEKLDAVIQAVLPSLHTDVYDAAMALFQNDGKYCAAYGLAIKDGSKSENLLLDFAKDLPAKTRGYLSLSAEKVGSVNLHKVNLPSQVLEEIHGEAPFFGEAELWLAIQDDALVVTFGHQAKERLKLCLAQSPEPAPM
ncbi:MAG TPA: hypothetical protein VGZ47_18105, partial [Gemmataceae bacterium]|nr:hypothetical protein [Gemmataceae bacterium]